MDSFEGRPDLDRAIIRSLDEHVELSPTPIGGSSELGLVTSTEHEITGLGSIQPLLDDPAIEEIWINQPGEVRFSRAGMVHVIESSISDSDIENLGQRLLRASSRRIDRIHPFADAFLADGSRVHIAIPPATARHWAINVRKFPAQHKSLDDLVRLEMLSLHQAQQLAAAVHSGLNILISGATNTGKTTLLAAMLGQLPSHRRVVSVEDTLELRLKNRDWVALQGRAEAIGEAEPIDLRRLVRETLRMRPDQLVVGEVRGAEALELVLAMNSGIPCAATIHAKSAAGAISKLMLLPTLAQANIDPNFMQSTVVSTLDLVVHLENRDGQRRVAEIQRLSGVVA